MSSAPPRISVLMTARDAAPYIAEAIESVRAQAFTDWELLVVDDASTDDTPLIVERLSQVDERIRLRRRSESGGPYVAANDGLRFCSGRFLARLDADDVAVRDRFGRQLSFLEQRPWLRGCMGEVQVLAGDVLLPFGPRVIPVLPGSLRWALAVRAFFPSTAMIETAAIREIGGYRELAASQDHRLWCNLARRRWLGVLPEVLAYWRRHDRQLSGRRFDLQQELGAEVVAEHLESLSGERWSAREAHVLRSIGASRPEPYREGRATLRRFERSWRADTTLSGEERGELAVLTRRLGKDQLREALRATMSESVPGRAALRAYARVNLTIREVRSRVHVS